ncbi:MAG: 23S rRNA (adenine(2503)-C(2))-methyltransferase RlmN [Candidatus Margulisiibacteriota bacterium]
MQNILEKTLDELIQEFQAFKLPAFRAKQVYAWLHRKLTYDFSEMSDLSKEIRAFLPEKYSIYLPKTKKTSKSKDGTKKYLFELEDGCLIETVFMETREERKTVCISTQVGCPLGCAFCATGKMPFKRNLTAAEIIGQLYQIAKEYPDISNLVFMGMGEPFLNYENVMKAVNILLSDQGANFGQRRITISTSGIPDKIMAFAREDSQVRLAVSLNSADGKVRSELMPVNIKYPLPKLMEAVEYYISKTGRRVTLEYIMLEGVNDSEEAAEKLVRLCKKLSVTVNLITYSRVVYNFKPSPKEVVDYFVAYLNANGIVTTVRRSRGEEIKAACGQLAAKNKA